MGKGVCGYVSRTFCRYLGLAVDPLLGVFVFWRLAGTLLEEDNEDEEDPFLRISFFRGRFGHIMLKGR